MGQNCGIKHQLKQSQLRYLVDAYTSQIVSGLTPEQVKFTTSKLELQGASVAGIVEAYEFISSAIGHELIKRHVMICYLLKPEANLLISTGGTAK